MGALKRTIAAGTALALALTLTGCFFGAADSDENYCYDLTCNGKSTGNQCFDDHDAYCKSLCAERVCAAAALCADECH